MCVTRINLDLMMTAVLHSTSSKEPISGDRSQVNWDEFVHSEEGQCCICRGYASVSVRSPDVLMNECPHKWWSTLKSALYGSSSDSSLPHLIGAGGFLVCEPVGKADMLSAHFYGKQSRDPVDLSSTCHPSSSLTAFVFRSRKVKRLLPDLDSYGGTDPLDMFPLFLMKTAEILSRVSPRLAVAFRRLFRLG